MIIVSGVDLRKYLHNFIFIGVEEKAADNIKNSNSKSKKKKSNGSG